MPLDLEKISLLNDIAGDDTRTPHSMPGWYYGDAAVYEVEKTEIFSAGWVCVGHHTEILKAGMYITAMVGDEPVVVLRDRDHVVRAYSNVCRHRGMRLVEGAGKASVLTCPYHAWSYHLNGTLNKAPYMDGVAGFDKDKCALPEFNVEEWMGFVFVNIDGKADPFGDGLAGLQSYLEHYEIDTRHSMQTWVEHWGTNWKALVENFMEGYHLSITHPFTLDPITPTDLCVKLDNSPQFTAYRANYRPDAEPRTPYPEGLTADERRSSILFNVYPNLVVTAGPNCGVFLILLPEDAGSVKIKMGILVQNGADDLPSTKSYTDLAHKFNAEDKITLEAMQKNTRTKHRPMSPLAPADYEGTVWDFTKYIAKMMAKPAGK